MSTTNLPCVICLQHFKVASDHQLVPTASEADAQQKQPLPLDSSVVSWYERLTSSRPPIHQLERGYDSTATRKRQPGAGGVVDSIGSPPPSVSQLTDSCSDKDASILAVVGIKSAVGNFDRRQAIRETWAKAELGPLSGRACLLFVTGRAGPGLPQETAAALALEAVVYGDLFGVGPGTEYKEGDIKEATANNSPRGEGLRLRSDPPVEAFGNNPPSEVSGNIPLGDEVLGNTPPGVWDGYENLIDKTVWFMETAMDHMPHYEYLVMMDDDVYLRLDLLCDWLDKRVPQADERGFYAGQVGAYFSFFSA